jgi:N-acetylneuraminic acid mutarotase
MAENSAFTVAFSEAMDPATISAATILLSDNVNNPLSGTVKYSYVTPYGVATFTPAANLQVGVTYTATVTTGVKDTTGNALATAYVWSFTITPDITPPTVVQSSPPSGASGIGTSSVVWVRFSEAMDPATISAATILLSDNLNNPVSGTVTYSYVTPSQDVTFTDVTFTPAANLQVSTTYTATVTTGVKDTAGNALATAYAWSFTTAPAVDITPPTVISTSPANGATCVPTETNILAVFSEAVLSQTVNTDTFLLKDSLNNTIGGVAGGGYDGLTVFIPNSPLANTSSYTGILTTGIADLAGNYLAADFTWAFTTQAEGTGTWNAISTTGAPSARYGHTTIWTGAQMIIWGGYTAVGGFVGDGARYDPAADTWAPISSVGSPSARSGHVAVWTGSKMIIWGGVQPGTYLNSGAIYDPSSDTWATMSTSGAPSGRQFATAVWTGTEMIVWGGEAGQGLPADGARYNPSTNAWSTVSKTDAPTARWGHTGIWTGSKMLIWGGSDGTSVFLTGGVYTPSSDSWTVIPITGAPAARRSHSAVWTGTEMIVWGGYDGFQSLNTGARFNPTSNSWQSMSSACAPLARFGHSGVWSGTELIVWGGGSDSNCYFYRAGGRYNPSTDTWQATPIVGVPSARMYHTGIWTGTDLIVWGGRDVFGTQFNNGGMYRPQ